VGRIGFVTLVICNLESAARIKARTFFLSAVSAVSWSSPQDRERAILLRKEFVRCSRTPTTPTMVRTGCGIVLRKDPSNAKKNAKYDPLLFPRTSVP